MESPLYDHELDAYPTVAGAADAIARKGMGGGAGTDPEGRRKFVSARPAWPWLAAAMLGPLGVVGLLVIRSLPPTGRLRPGSQALRLCGGAALLVLSAWSLLLIPMLVLEFGGRLTAWPYLGLAWLLGVGVLILEYVKGMNGRLDRFRSDAEWKGATPFALMLAAFGFLGGGIPGSLRGLVWLGLFCGLFASLDRAMSFSRIFEQVRDGDEDSVCVMGDAVVHGHIEGFESGPYAYHVDGQPGESTGTGGNVTFGRPGTKGWVRINRQGVVRGRSLRVEQLGRGLNFQGRTGLRIWMLLDGAGLLTAVLLVVASATAARGDPLGYVLLATLTGLCLGYNIAIMAWLGDVERAIFCVFAVMVLIVLSRPRVRSYLGRPMGGRPKASPPERRPAEASRPRRAPT